MVWIHSDSSILPPRSRRREQIVLLGYRKFYEETADLGCFGAEAADLGCFGAEAADLGCFGAEAADLEQLTWGVGVFWGRSS